MCGTDTNHTHTAGADLSLALLADQYQTAWRNQFRLDTVGVRCINLMSSPGAGKTCLLERTLTALQGALRLAVLEGDMTTELDAERLRACGVPVIAITTGRACHLDANLVAAGLQQLEQASGLSQLDILMIENVGNLVCPAEFPLGEHAKVALVSITEGEDKPLKYPLMFHAADCIVVTKLDLLPYLKFNVALLIANIRQVNAHAPVFVLSAETGEGLDEWLTWLRTQAVTPPIDASHLPARSRIIQVDM